MLRRIHIRNFRSLEDVEVELSPVTVLIGGIGTGKTNFLQAIRYLRDHLLFGPTKAAQLSQGRLTGIHSNDSDFSLDVFFDVANDVREYHYFATFGHAGKVLGDLLEVGGVVVFSRTSRKWDVAPPGYENLESTFSESTLTKCPGIKDVTTASIVLSQGVGYYSFPMDVLRRPETAASIAGLDDLALNILSTWQLLSQDFSPPSRAERIIRAIAQVAPVVDSIGLSAPLMATDMVVGYRHDELVTPMSITWASDGLRRLIATLAALYQIPSKHLLMFEEPENGIYPRALAMLADEFHAAADEGRGQVILTTHNPKLLDYFAADEIRAVEMEGLSTKIGPLAKDQYESLQESLLAPGELLTVDRPRRRMPLAEEAAP
jgi:predicted ATPase